MSTSISNSSFRVSRRYITDLYYNTFHPLFYKTNKNAPWRTSTAIVYTFYLHFQLSTTNIDKKITKYSVVDETFLQVVDIVDKLIRAIATGGFIWYYVCA
ncbi:hypothetical protein [Halobacillus litoralis]|uniref:hypothetical protein n=1 Tax=Halobacillus litoralis TaxID=45668 RepID=UPI001CFEF504|nr:hypothetical protein [Halobacillus litoralis]